MITGVHFLLTYACNFECDHCFLFCGPKAGGTFTLARLRQAFDQIYELGTVKSIYFEGGEPFLYYPLLREGIRLSKERGLSVGAVTNAYWAASEEDGRLWLDDLVDRGLDELHMSDDEFHSREKESSPGKKKMFENYIPESHPIAGPLLRGTGIQDAPSGVRSRAGRPQRAPRVGLHPLGRAREGELAVKAPQRWLQPFGADWVLR